MKNILIILAVALLSACTNSDKATNALQGAGYKDITITGYKIFGCSDDDHFHAGFSATGPTGQRVDGVVCSGILKGATIRTN